MAYDPDKNMLEKSYAALCRFKHLFKHYPELGGAIVDGDGGWCPHAYIAAEVDPLLQKLAERLPGIYYDAKRDRVYRKETRHIA